MSNKVFNELVFEQFNNSRIHQNFTKVFVSPPKASYFKPEEFVHLNGNQARDRFMRKIRGNLARKIHIRKKNFLDIGILTESLESHDGVHYFYNPWRVFWSSFFNMLAEFK